MAASQDCQITGTAEYAFTPTSMTGKTVMNRQGQAMATNMSAKRSGHCT